MNLREDISKFLNIARIPGPSQRLHANQVPSELGIPNALYSTFRPSELVDNDVIDIKCMQKIKIYYAKIILPKFHAYLTSHSRVIVHVLFLEHLRYFRF